MAASSFLTWASWASCLLISASRAFTFSISLPMFSLDTFASLLSWSISNSRTEIFCVAGLKLSCESTSSYENFHCSMRRSWEDCVLAMASWSLASLPLASSRSLSRRTCICRVSASWAATEAWCRSTTTSCSEFLCSWALSRTLCLSTSSSFSSRCLLSSRISKSFFLIRSRASSRCAVASCVSATRLRRSFRSSAMTCSSMATFWT
mmetsp:Transcript_6375/g.17034  ORF Transcript_6375/g.17034 Transcript_6375/m.17034 type:complete len:207 (+) Transcript_6375:838-1458(+)